MAPLIVPAAVGLSLGGAACNREDCGDGQDNDGDGLADCADDDCFGVGSCPDPDTIAPPVNEEYAAPNLPEPMPMPMKRPPPVAPAPPPEEDDASRPRPMYADDPNPPELMQKAVKGSG